MEKGLSVEQSEHTQYLSMKFVIWHGYSLWCPKTIRVVTSVDRCYNSNIADHYKKHNNEKVWNRARTTNMWQSGREQMLLEKLLAWCRVAIDIWFIKKQTKKQKTKQYLQNKIKQVHIYVKSGTDFTAMVSPLLMTPRDIPLYGAACFP